LVGAGKIPSLYFDFLVPTTRTAHLVGEEMALQPKILSVSLAPVAQGQGERSQNEEWRLPAVKRLMMPVGISGFIDIDYSSRHIRRCI
jgi:hypothetical protein